MTKETTQNLTQLIQIKKLKLRITKAKTVKEELSLRIIERKLDIVRMEENLASQDGEILKAEEALEKVKET